ncbi:hypothetical protein EMEDMD4_1280010 [Sinorhizobium medicae]|uniref:Uncharacterized protein n=1 Tax=Sinorhizobium medicae TaxID=110321 RepID=A0A508WRD9_9HYPH|nr:hypothetical protein EMEDMD4_1280010 [Sinorhizobium medicae]
MPTLATVALVVLDYVGVQPNGYLLPRFIDGRTPSRPLDALSQIGESFREPSCLSQLRISRLWCVRVTGYLALDFSLFSIGEAANLAGLVGH